MKEKEIVLVGVDIYKFVERLCNQILTGSPDMTAGEKKAYQLGINNALRLLNQTPDEIFDEGLIDYDQYLVHVPGLEIVTEFANIEEVQNKIKTEL